MTTRKTIVVLLCFVFMIVSFGLLFNSMSNIERQLEELSYVSQNQMRDIEALKKETEDWEVEIDSLYELNKSHVNCVAMAMLAHEESILADMYNRTEEEQSELYKNDNSFANYYGRLYIPDVMIDVALYLGNSQVICDRDDSANLFTLSSLGSGNIADHNYQEFSKLFSVKVGTLGYIQLVNGDIINIKCVDVFNGHNTGFDLTDEEGNSVIDTSDYLMYTCRNGWMNVRICLWDKY